MIIDNTEILKQLEKERKSLSDLKRKKLLFNSFWDDFKMRLCWSSNSLEGNTLDLEETVEIIQYDEVRSGHTYQEYTEAKNLYRAINEQISSEKTDITEEWIKKCNALIIGADGEYRKKDVYIGTIAEAAYFPPSHEKMEEAMNEIMKQAEIREADLEGIIRRTAEFHIKFERIHPFSDGNGRTGRMILNQQLINNDMLPIAIDKTSKYRQAFRLYDKNADISMLVHLICSNELKAIDRVKELQRKVVKKNGQIKR